MPKLPDKNALGGPPSLRSGRAMVSASDLNVDAISSGFQKVGSALLKYSEEEAKENDAIDLVNADADQKTALLELQRSFDTDPEFETYDPRFKAAASGITAGAATRIRNPRAREKWLAQARLTQETVRDRVLDRGTSLARQTKIVQLDEALGRRGAAFLDPNIDDNSRAQALADMEVYLEAGRRTGLLGPVAVHQLRQKHVDGAISEYGTNWINSAGLDVREKAQSIIQQHNRGAIERHSDGMATVMAGSGAAFRVAGDYADRFAGALSDLEAAGIDIKGDQSGGFADRNIRGTNKPSQHKFGQAIDINWQENARGTKGAIDPELARNVAKKWGLTWGGDWKNPDPMHFEIDPKAAPAADAPRGVTQSGNMGQGADEPEDRSVNGLFARWLLKNQDKIDVAEQRHLAAFRKNIEAMEKQAEEGYPPPLDDIEAIKAKTASFADKPIDETGVTIGNAVSRLESSARYFSEIRRLNPTQLRAEIDSQLEAAEAKGGFTEDARDRVKRGQTLLNTMEGQLREDPLGWSNRVGTVELMPLDFSDNAKAAASIDLRIEQAEDVQRFYGLKNPVYLTPDEAQRIAGGLNEGGDATLATAALVARAGRSRATAIFGEVSKHAPSMAFLGDLVSRTGMDTPIARDAADGIALAKQDDFQRLAPTPKAAQSAKSEVLGTALSALPKTENAAIAVANAAYEVRARRQNIVDFDDRLWQQGLREALGEREVNGETYGGIVYQGGGFLGWGSVPVIVPPNVKQDGFPDLIGALRSTDLIDPFGNVPSTADGRPISLAVIQRAKLLTVGPGRYWLALGNLEEDPQFVMSGGQPFVLDLGTLEDTLRKRRPDLYAGGK